MIVVLFIGAGVPIYYWRVRGRDQGSKRERGEEGEVGWKFWRRWMR